ncbi:MAG: phospholipase/carboxylesterase [Candidatus Saganbacteria bacterium]|uniref:Phospholipase/carboxylesterase n=1 Tax=Candidatus Saganbacteria bacterium TaxID=2575572 RepID=A0A833L003_UNCSA|nr:MAG: phospholipase/carboxylesterase [Candidatus Saganbacteria bacterium]
MDYLLMFLGGLLAVNLLVVPPVEQSILYLPSNDQYQMEGNFNHEDVFLKTTDGVAIHGWFVKNETSQKVILYFHGNAGNLTYNVDQIKALSAVPLSVFAIDYHGFGQSGGQPTEKNLYLDAQAAYDYLVKQKKYPPEQIIIMGTSLGGAVATHLAAREKVGGVILESTFTSVRDMAQRMSGAYRRPIVWIRSDFNSLDNIALIDAPLLIVHSKEDKSVPCEMAQALYNKAKPPKKLLLLEKGEHSGLLLANQEYLNEVKQMTGK